MPPRVRQISYVTSETIRIFYGQRRGATADGRAARLAHTLSGAMHPVFHMDETPPTADEPVARDETPRAGERTPWRVEGARDAPEKGARGSQMPGRRHLLWIVVAMLAVNWAIASRASVDHQRITVPYSYFRQQALVNNIAEVSSKDESIEGRFRREVRYPAGQEGACDARVQDRAPCVR
jgi:hypothetical protein